MTLKRRDSRIKLNFKMETFQTHIAGYFRKNSRSDWMNRWLVQKMLRRPVCPGAFLKYGSYCIFSVKIIAVTMPPKNPINILSNTFIYSQVYSHIYVFIFGINRRSTAFTISLFKSENLGMIFFTIRPSFCRAQSDLCFRARFWQRNISDAIRFTNFA